RGRAGDRSGHRPAADDDDGNRHRPRRNRPPRRRARLPGRRQDRHLAQGQRRRLCRQPLRRRLRRSGAGQPAALRHCRGDPRTAGHGIRRRRGVGAGLPPGHGWRTAADGRAAGCHRAVVRRARRQGAPHRRRGRRAAAGGTGMSRAMPLSQLLAGQPPLPAGFDPLITGLSADSRDVGPGGAFVALAGARTHGLRHAPAGAAAILFEPPLPADLAAPANAIAVPGLRGRQGELADRFYDAPSKAMAVTGVTGTNGKTSTVQLLAQALSLSGAVAGSIGTLGAGLHGQLEAGERTTPDVITVHRLLARMRDQGASHVAMEVSSHALDQGRVDAVAFRIAVFTNLTRDHLDYHGSMEAYGEAKARLFAWPGLQAVVINLDDPFGLRLHQGVSAGLRRIGVSSRGAAGASLRAEDVRLQPDGLHFRLVERGESQAVVSHLLGRFNVDNLLAVAGVLRALGWPLAEVAAMLPRLSPVGGRM